MRRCLAAAAAILTATTVACVAENMTLLVGFPPGQGADLASAPDASSLAGQRLSSEPTYEEVGRIYADRLRLFLPGAPKLDMKLVPGASSLVAARRLMADTRRDGSTLALLGARAALEPLVDTINAPWRPDDFAWIGALRRDDDVCVARTDAPVREIGDLTRKEMFVGALAPGSRSYLYARALNVLGGARLTIISGYGGEFEIARALETEEIQSWCGWSMAKLRAAYARLLRDGKARPIVQFTTTPAGQGLDIPRASDVPAGEADRAAMRALETQTRFGAFAMAAPPSTSPERVAELRKAYLVMANDPDTIRIAASRGLAIDPVSGEELQLLAAQLSALTPAARNRLRVVLLDK